MPCPPVFGCLPNCWTLSSFSGLIKANKYTRDDRRRSIEKVPSPCVSSSSSDAGSSTNAKSCIASSSVSSDCSIYGDKFGKRVHVLSVSGDELYTSGNDVFVILRDVQAALENALGIPPYRQQLLSQSVVLTRNSLLHTLTDLEELDLTLITLHCQPVDFKWLTSHGDIEINDGGGGVSIPEESCHGGYPVFGDCELLSGRYYWCIRVQQCPCPSQHRNFKAGVVPYGWTERDSRDHIVWMPHEENDVNSNSTKQKGTIVEIELDLFENVMKWSLIGSENINGLKEGAVDLPPGLSWKPAVKLSHRTCIRLVHSEWR